MEAWLSAHGWDVLLAVVGVAMVVGQYQQRQIFQELTQNGLVTRIETLERDRQEERGRLDLVYVLREVATAQQAAIIKSLDEVKGELRELRQAVR